jgi:hypothetical protein
MLPDSEREEQFEGTVSELGCCLSGDRHWEFMVASASGSAVAQFIQGFSRVWLVIVCKRSELISQGDMNPRICRCCGEQIPELGNMLSRNPNVCASCSSMADGMGASNVPECADLAPDQSVTADSTEKTVQGGLDDKVLEPVTHPVSTGG